MLVGLLNTYTQVLESSWLANIFLQVLRYLFTALDILAYGLMSKFYSLFTDLSNTFIFDPSAANGTLAKFSTRIYAFIGIFMLFRISFNILTYIINPDDFQDKAKGMGKVLSNTMVALLLVVSVPYIFRAAYDLQRVVLKENVIQRVFLGGSRAKNTASPGDQMAFTIESAFFRLDPEVNPVCENGADTYDADACNAITICSVDPLTDACHEALGDVTSTEVADYYHKAWTEEHAWSLVNYTTSTATFNNQDKVYVFEYQFLISTIAGAFGAWIILMFCIDVAVRSIKLGFLQLVSPIPIILYIDPKKGKETFDKWLKQCTSTYIGLFVRIAAVSFAAFIISEVGVAVYKMDSTGNNYVVNKDNPFINVFIVIGMLMFANQIPKLLEDILGIKLEGTFTLDPRKKLGQSALASGAVGGALGLAGGAAANLAAIPSRIKEEQKKIQERQGVDAATAKAMYWKGIDKDGIHAKSGSGSGFRGVSGRIISYGASTVAGSASAGYNSLNNGMRDKDYAKAAFSGIKTSSQNRNLRHNNKFDIPDKILEPLAEMAQIKNEQGAATKMKGELKRLERELSDISGEENKLSSAMSMTMGSNPLKSSNYAAIDKFKRLKDKNDKEIIQYTYGSYAEYIAGANDGNKRRVTAAYNSTYGTTCRNFDEVQNHIKFKVTSNPANANASESEIKNLITTEFDTLVNPLVNVGAMSVEATNLNANEFSNYRSMQVAKEEANVEQLKVQKKIKSLQDDLEKTSRPNSGGGKK